MKLIVPVSSLATLLFSAGCATDYTCGAFPGSKCKNVDQVYEETSGGVQDYRRSMYKNDRGQKSCAEEKLVISTSPAALQPVKAGEPILTKPVVRRVLIASWQDVDRDLHTGGYIYIRLRESEWRL